MFYPKRVYEVSVPGKKVNKNRNFSLIHLVLFEQCKVGFAGDGRICGTDSDLDSWPDMNLPCSNPRCRKVSEN